MNLPDHDLLKCLPVLTDEEKHLRTLAALADVDAGRTIPFCPRTSHDTPQVSGDLRKNLVTKVEQVRLHCNHLLKYLSGLLRLVQMPLASAAEERTVSERTLLGKNAMAHRNVVGNVSKPLIHNVEHAQRIALSVAEHLIIDGDGVSKLINNHQITKMLVERLTPELSRAAKRRRLGRIVSPRRAD